MEQLPIYWRNLTDRAGSVEVKELTTYQVEPDVLLSCMQKLCISLYMVHVTIKKQLNPASELAEFLPPFVAPIAASAVS